MPTREEIFALSDLVIEKIHVPEWNLDLHVRSLSGAEKAKWEQESLIDDPKNSGVKLSRDRMRTARERLVELATCNEDGSRFFKDGDSAAIGKKNANAISRLYDAAAKLSGITKEDLGEAVKNFEADPDGGSPSA